LFDLFMQRNGRHPDGKKFRKWVFGLAMQAAKKMPETSHDPL